MDDPENLEIFSFSFIENFTSFSKKRRKTSLKRFVFSPPKCVEEEKEEKEGLIWIVEFASSWDYLESGWIDIQSEKWFGSDWGFFTHYGSVRQMLSKSITIKYALNLPPPPIKKLLSGVWKLYVFIYMILILFFRLQPLNDSTKKAISCSHFCCRCDIKGVEK